MNISLKIKAHLGISKVSYLSSIPSENILLKNIFFEGQSNWYFYSFCISRVYIYKCEKYFLLSAIDSL